MNNSRLIFIFLLAALMKMDGQVLSHPQQNVQMNTARYLENQNRLDEAITLYKDILIQNETHPQAFRRLKDIYVRLERYDEAVELIEARLASKPKEMQTILTLGEIYYKQSRIQEAYNVWREMEASFPKNLSTYRLLFNTYVRLSLEDELVSMVKRARMGLNSPHALALELGNYYYARRIYPQSMSEYLLYLRHEPRQTRLISSRILLMSDEEEAHPYIVSALEDEISHNEHASRELLSSYYFKTRRYKDALDQQKLLGLQSNQDYDRWLRFSESLRQEQAYSLALDAYSTFLSLEEPIPARLKGKALIGLAQTFEDQIIPEETGPQFVKYFPENIFFESHFYFQRDVSSQSVASAFNLYDSVLVNIPSSGFSAQASFRLGEIQYRMTRNFDGAEQSYETALRSKPDKELEALIRLRLGDILLARGNLSAAAYYFQNEINRGIEFQTRFIQSLLYQGYVDSAITALGGITDTIAPMNPWFNDVLELVDFLDQGLESDSEILADYFKGEYLLRQYKLVEAADFFAYIRQSYPSTNLGHYLLLRESLIRLQLEDYSSVFSLTSQLKDTEFYDKGIVLTGQIHEGFQDKEKALEFYFTLLEDHPESLLSEPVRLHVRSLTKTMN